MAQDRKNGNSDKSMTAVEWLESKLDDLLDIYPTEWEAVNLLIVKAIEMEKEQAFQLFKAGQDSMEECGKNFEQYYEKYNGSELDKE